MLKKVRSEVANLRKEHIILERLRKEWFFKIHDLPELLEYLVEILITREISINTRLIGQSKWNSMSNILYSSENFMIKNEIAKVLEVIIITKSKC